MSYNPNPLNLIIGDIIKPTGSSWPNELKAAAFTISHFDDEGCPMFRDFTGMDWNAEGPDDSHWAVKVVSRFAGRPQELVTQALLPVDDEPEAPDNVNHPAHYKAANGLEVSDFLDAFVGDDPQLWNTGKYIMRAGKKDPAKFVEDLEKAVWYIQRRITIAKAQR